MQKKTCPNGHVYDPSIYGDQCPLCPAGGAAVASPSAGSPATHLGTGPQMPPAGGLHTHIANGGFQAGGPTANISGAGADPAGSTKLRPQDAEPKPAGNGHTVIRHANMAGRPAQNQPSRKLVGFLVSYSRDPNGRAYNIYEGRNFIGRDSSCDISVPDDDQMSSRHLSILFRNVDNKFKYRDEQSSNGTFINKELSDDGELQNYDIIRAGSTIFVFIAIPNFG